jgi:hypothetical protein
MRHARAQVLATRPLTCGDASASRRNACISVAFARPQKALDIPFDRLWRSPIGSFDRRVSHPPELPAVDGEAIDSDQPPHQKRQNLQIWAVAMPTGIHR